MESKGLPIDSYQGVPLLRQGYTIPGPSRKHHIKGQNNPGGNEQMNFP